MRTITFYSYKGGVGRSLALSNIAIRLSEFNKSVCVLDFDLEAPGLQFKFNDYSKSEDIKLGIVDYINDFSLKGIVPSSIRDYSITLNPSNKLFKPITFIPAGDVDNPIYWKKLSSVNWEAMFYGTSSNGVKFFLDLKKKIIDEFNPDFFLIDSRTGITDISGITLKILADEVVILAANNKENLYGSKKIIESLTNKSNSLFGTSPKIHFILTRLPFTDTIRDKEKEFKIVEKRRHELLLSTGLSDLEILVIHSDRRLEEDERPLIGDDYEERGVSISNDYLKLFDNLTKDLLTIDEIQLFKDKKNAEKEYGKARFETDYAKKIQYLNNSIKFDNTKYEYYLLLGDCYSIQKDFQKALSSYFQALELNSQSNAVFHHLASLYVEMKEYNKALIELDRSIKMNPKDLKAIKAKGDIYERQGKYSEALDLYNFVIDLAPNDDHALNNRADILRTLGNLEKASEDIFKAIEINPDRPVYFGTLAEIYASKEKFNEFYLNLIIALSKGLDASTMSTASEVYTKFLHDERFLNLMDKYKIDIDEIFLKK